MMPDCSKSVDKADKAADIEQAGITLYVSRGSTALHLEQSGITLLSQQLSANLVSGATSTVYSYPEQHQPLQILLYMCPHTAMCPHLAVYVSSSCCICVHILEQHQPRLPRIWSFLNLSRYLEQPRIWYLEQPVSGDLSAACKAWSNGYYSKVVPVSSRTSAAGIWRVVGSLVSGAVGHLAAEKS